LGTFGFLTTLIVANIISISNNVYKSGLENAITPCSDLPAGVTWYTRLDSTIEHLEEENDKHLKTKL